MRGTERPLERNRSHFDDADFEAALATGGGDLRTDEPRADDHDPLGPRIQLGTQREAVVERAQHVHAREIGLLRQIVEPTAPVAITTVSKPTLLAVVQGDRATGHVERRGAPTEQPVDLELLVRGREHDAVGIPRAREHLFRQGRTVVRLVRVSVDHGDATVETRLAKRVRGVHPGEGCADDEDVAQS